MVCYGFIGRNPPANAGPAKTQVWSLDGEDPLEEEMATHCSILAWETSWTEEPCGLQSMGLQRARHNWDCVPMCTVHTHTHRVYYRILNIVPIPGPCLSILHITACICWPQIPNPPLPSPSPWQTQIRSLCLWVCFRFVVKFICVTF